MRTPRVLPGLLPATARWSVPLTLGVLVVSACAAVSSGTPEPPTDDGSGPPARFVIAPDDWSIPYAGTAEDGRRFFLSDALFDASASYVGLFLWKSDGTFDEMRVDAAPRTTDTPPGQAVSAGADGLVQARLAELGEYVVEPIEVEPFTAEVDGVTFGWLASEFEGTWSVNVEPGDFIAYYAPWDGEYDT